MSLKLIIGKLEDVPEAQRELYEPTEDKKGFRLTVEGLPDASKLEKALDKERLARADFEKKLKAFEGLDPEEAKALRDRFENDEEFQLFKSGDKEKLREKWTEKMRADYEKQLKAATAAVEDASKKAGKWSQRVLDNAIREAAAKVGIHSHAVEDALFRGRSMFSLDEDGNAVQVRDGTVVLGKNGKTPYSPTEWLESMRESAPHWFPAAAAGGGASGNKGSGANGQQRSITRSQFDALTPKEKMEHAKSGGAVIEG